MGFYLIVFNSVLASNPTHLHLYRPGLYMYFVCIEYLVEFESLELSIALLRNMPHRHISLLINKTEGLQMHFRNKLSGKIFGLLLLYRICFVSLPFLA
jgi:hypothetical protein